MAEARPERVLTGVAASDGLVAGPLVVERTPVAADRAAGSPEHEVVALRAALDRASCELEDSCRV